MTHNDVEAALNEYKQSDSTFWLQGEQVSILPPAKSAGLQIADAAATSFYYGLRLRYRFTESRYARMLKPVIHQHEGKYAISLWGDAEALKANSHWTWLFTHFS